MDKFLPSVLISVVLDHCSLYSTMVPEHCWLGAERSPEQPVPPLEWLLSPFNK
jgi:hypothetical protein